MEARRSAREETPNQRQVKCAPRSEHARPDELKLVLTRSCDDTLRRIGTRVVGDACHVVQRELLTVSTSSPEVGKYRRQ